MPLNGLTLLLEDYAPGNIFLVDVCPSQVMADYLYSLRLKLVGGVVA
jgi:hypothetical protein